MARSKVKSTKDDVQTSIRTGMKIEEAARRRVLLEGLMPMFPKADWGHAIYTTEFLTNLYLQHKGSLPEGFEDKVEEEVNEAEASE